MTLAALSWAMYGDHGDLDPTARMILAVLADHAGHDAVAWPSRATMASAAGCSHDTVERRLRALVDAGLIRPADPSECPAAWHHWRPDRRPNAYFILLPTGTQPAYPSPATGTQTGATGTQKPAHGYAAVRTEPKEPKLESARARASRPDPPPTPSPPRVAACRSCRRWHPDTPTCPRPADPAARARARQAVA